MDRGGDIQIRIVMVTQRLEKGFIYRSSVKVEFIYYFYWVISP